MRSVRGWLAVLAVSFALAAFGCGGKDRAVKLEGVVTLDGERLEGAIVSFLPDEGGGRFASGVTAKNGAFQLTTYLPDDGVLPGNYRVTVTLIPDEEDEDESKTKEEGTNQKAVDGQQMMAAMARVAAARQKALERSPVPAIYRDGGKTPLRQIVPPKGKVVLALTRKPVQ